MKVPSSSGSSRGTSKGMSPQEQRAWRTLLLKRTARLLEDPDRDLELHDVPGEEYFCRRGQVVLGLQETEQLRGELEELGAEQVEVDLELGTVLHRLPDGLRVHDAVERLRKGARDPEALITPHHVLFAAPRWGGSPGGPAHPAGPVVLVEGPGGKGVLVAVLDTGQAEESMALPWVQGHVDVVDLDPVDEDGDGRIDPEAGHGTFVTGVLGQAAPGVRVLALRVLDGEGVTDEMTVVKAVRTALAEGAQVLNLSLGGYTCSDLGARLIERALADSGAVAVAAAGNDGVDRPFHPAASSAVIGVAALTRRGTRAFFSNHGPWVDACADGVELQSTYVTGREAEVWEADGVDDFTRPYATWSGTSFAAPQVAAAIAMRIAEHGEDPHAAAAAVLAAGPVLSGLGTRVRTRVRSTV